MAIKHDQTEQNFNFHRQGNNGRVVVLNNLSYTMAEYDQVTGLTRWHRVVPAAQRDKIQTWLLSQYPVIVEALPATPRKRKQAA